MRFAKILLGLVSVASVWGDSGSAYAGQAAAKPLLTLEALFRLEDITDAAFSPDGRSIAFVRSRSRSGTNERYLGGRLGPHQREDVWIANAKSVSSPRPLTFGVQHGASYWIPTWSPDGRRLLVLTNQDFENIHLEMIDVASGTRRRISERGMDLEADVTGSTEHTAAIETRIRPMIWLDEHRVLFVELAAGDVSAAIAQGTRRIRKTEEQWNLTESGREPSFSALNSRKDRSPRAPGRLAVADLRAGTLTPLAEGVFRRVTVSPDGRFAAIIAEEAPWQLHGTTYIHWGRMWRSYQTSIDFHTSLLVVRLDGTPQVLRFPQVRDPVFDWIPGGLSAVRSAETYYGPTWLARRPVVALLGRKHDDGERDDSTAFLIDVEQQAVHEISHPGIGVINLAVVGDDVFLRGNGDLSTPFSAKTKYEWYSADFDAVSGPRRLGNRGYDAKCVIPLTETTGVVIDTVAGGLAVLRKGSAVQETPDERLKGARILWPNGHVPQPRGTGIAVVQLSNTRLAFIRDTSTGVVLESPWHAPEGSPQSFNLRTRTVASIARSSKGTEIFIGTPETGSQSIEKINAFLQHFGDPKYMDLSYVTSEGRKLVARLFLPPTYRQGDRLPILTFVYVYQRTPADLSYGRSDSFLNMSMALHHGFGVLYPTINTAEEYGKGRPYESVKRDVVPAVEVAIAARVADPERVYVLGHSYGAYSVYALVSQTDIFAAAAAINGPSDLVTTYFDLDPNLRYSDWAFEHQQGAQGELERMHPVMGLQVTPWQDYGRYVMNSPLRHVDRVHTPLLIFQSDADVFDMHQADNMFSALTRLGREARYVRVWGEAHSFDSPANIRMFWDETMQWFQEHRRSPLGR